MNRCLFLFIVAALPHGIHADTSRQLMGYTVGEASPPPPSFPPSPPPPPPSSPPPPVAVESRLPQPETTGIPGAAAKIGAPGTVGGVSQVKAYAERRRGRKLSASTPRANVVKCTDSSATGCLELPQPSYDLLSTAASYELEQENEPILFAELPGGDINAGSANHISWGDYDNDGDLDAVVSRAGASNELLKNDGGGTFSLVVASAIGSETTTTTMATQI